MKILTSKGFRGFKGTVCRQSKVGTLVIGNSSIRCTEDHRVLWEGQWKQAKAFPGFVIDDELVNVYDAVEVDDGHEYLTNGIPSHNCVYLDEFAHVENDTEFYQSTYPVITSGSKTKVIITSTANGMNLFYKIWSEAEEGRNDYVPVRVAWNDHPKRDQAWFDEQCRNMPRKQVAQEILCEFLGSSDTLISGSKLQTLTFKKPTRGNDEGTLKLYEEPKPSHNYVVAVDVAEGTARDYSVCSVIDVTQQPYQQVAVYRSNLIPPLLFSKVVFDLGMKYNEALLVVENNNSGSIVCTHLWEEFEYENMLTTRIKDGENKISGIRSVPGVKTTKKSKAIGCSSLKALIESDMLIVNDFDTVSEFSTFSLKGNSYEAEPGKNDDCVMTLVLFAWFYNEPYFSEMVDENVKGILLKRLEEIDENQMLNMWVDDGTEDNHCYDESLIR